MGYFSSILLRDVRRIRNRYDCPRDGFRVLGGRILHRLFSTFPGGWPGVGLLLLRLAASFNLLWRGLGLLLVHDTPKFEIWLIGAIWFVSGLCLLMGFLTPIVSAAASLGCSATVLSLLPWIPKGDLEGKMAFLDITVIIVALIFLGPGAFSLDARLFGRREIIIPSPHRSTGI